MHNKKYFIVASHGWSASNWLAYALNKHNDITMSHSAANFVNVKLSNDIKDHVKRFHQGYVDRQGISIDDNYDEIEKQSDTPFYGSVQLYRLRDLPIQYEKFGIPKRTFNVANLIRNPVSLVWSGYHQFIELFKTDINELHWTTGKILDDKEFLYYITQKYDLLPGDYHNLAFLGAARILGSLRLDLDASEQMDKIPFIRYFGEVKMEDVTTSPDCLRALIRNMTDCSADVSEEYLNSVFAIGKINKHKKTKENLSIKDLYHSLKVWQKETLRYYLDKYSIIAPYKSFGYDLSFLQ